MFFIFVSASSARGAFVFHIPADDKFYWIVKVDSRPDLTQLSTFPLPSGFNSLPFSPCFDIHLTNLWTIINLLTREPVRVLCRYLAMFRCHGHTHDQCHHGVVARDRVVRPDDLSMGALASSTEYSRNAACAVTRYQPAPKGAIPSQTWFAAAAASPADRRETVARLISRRSGWHSNRPPRFQSPRLVAQCAQEVADFGPAVRRSDVGKALFLFVNQARCMGLAVVRHIAAQVFDDLIGRLGMAVSVASRYQRKTSRSSQSTKAPLACRALKLNRASTCPRSAARRRRGSMTRSASRTSTAARPSGAHLASSEIAAIAGNPGNRTPPHRWRSRLTRARRYRHRTSPDGLPGSVRQMATMDYAEASVFRFRRALGARATCPVLSG